MLATKQDFQSLKFYNRKREDVAWDRADGLLAADLAGVDINDLDNNQANDDDNYNYISDENEEANDDDNYNYIPDENEEDEEFLKR